VVFFLSSIMYYVKGKLLSDLRSVPPSDLI
jgi:hypothetical protein